MTQGSTLKERSALAVAMGTPQLVTALIGAAAALLVARALQAAGVTAGRAASATR